MLSRILLLGAESQVTKAFQRQGHERDLDLIVPSIEECDFSKPSSIRLTLQKTNPDIVINCVALDSLVDCEKNVDLARKINFEGPAVLAAVCSSLDCPVIHLSTDCVFNGYNQERPYIETDPMDPLTLYGESRMMGEEAIRHDLLFHIILRTGPIYSLIGNNLLTDSLNSLKAHETLSGISDRVFNPIDVQEVIKALKTIIHMIVSGSAFPFGTYHLTGKDAITHFDFIQLILGEFNKYRQSNSTLIKTTLSESPVIAQPPPYAALDSSKWNKMIPSSSGDYANSVATLLKEALLSSVE